jgi:hypothetical protein
MPPGYGNNDASLLLLLPVTAEAMVRQCYQRLAGSQPPIRPKYGWSDPGGGLYFCPLDPIGKAFVSSSLFRLATHVFHEKATNNPVHTAAMWHIVQFN